MNVDFKAVAKVLGVILAILLLIWFARFWVFAPVGGSSYDGSYHNTQTRRERTRVPPPVAVPAAPRPSQAKHDFATACANHVYAKMWQQGPNWRCHRNEGWTEQYGDGPVIRHGF